MQKAIHHAEGHGHNTHCPADLPARADSLPLRTCFFYCALFATVRDLLERFQSTNPMWLKPPKSYCQRIATTWSALSEGFCERVRYLADRLVLDCQQAAGHSSFHTASATHLPFPKAAFDAALTSPPYATRIDYVQGTRPELAVLGASEDFMTNLRKYTTGTPVVTGVTDDHAASVDSEYWVSAS